MTLDERVAVALGWERHPDWGWYPPGEAELAERIWCVTGKKAAIAPDFSSNWQRVPEMLDWLEVDCYLKVALRRGADVCAHKDESMGIMLAWQGGHSLPEALAKVVVCVAESRLRNYPSHTIEYKEEP